MNSFQPTFFYNFSGYQEVKPHNKLLLPYVECFYEISTDIVSFPAVPVMPDGCMDIVFIDNGKEINSYILGTAETLLGMYVNANRYVLGIRFKPVGISKFLSMTYNDIISHMIPLDDVAKNIFKIDEKILSLNFADKVILLECILLNNICVNSTKTDLVFSIAEYIISSKGNINIKALSKEYFYSERYINKLFHEVVGVSPKHFSEIIQLQSTINSIINCDDKLSDIAISNGYYDQSHMNHVIKKYLKTTTKELKTNEFFEKNREDLDIAYIY